MKVLITGGAGFIGSHVADEALRQNHEAVIVDNLCLAGEGAVHPDAAFYVTDIRDPALDDIFAAEKPDCVVHMAAQIDVQRSLANPVFDADVNILGTIRVLEACVKHGVRKLVYSSSAAVYGRPVYLGIDERHPVAPISFYGVSKSVPEHYIRCFSEMHGLSYTILRYANVYGPRQDPKGEAGVVSIFLDKLLSGERPVIFGDGEQTRDFVYVEDVARANVLALTRGAGETVNIGCSRPVTVNELLRTLHRLTGSPLKPKYAKPRPGDIPDSYLENAKAQQALGWEPRYTLDDGLRETIGHFRHIRTARELVSF